MRCECWRNVKIKSTLGLENFAGAYCELFITTLYIVSTKLNLEIYWQLS